MTPPGRSPDFAEQRQRMVERQLRRRGISDEAVLEAMGSVPRELFVPESVRRSAYNDSALPIGHEQTISQPWVVAAICQALHLDGDENVLEIGTGSGYSAAVLAKLSDRVISVERVPALGEAARARLEEIGVRNVEVIIGDGSQGHSPAAPYDAIAVHAATPEAPHSLLGQLAEGGRLVAPIATGTADLLTAFTRENGD
ncbi:MAG TPA: protein-L-isoaspartate(D-aspartate) O-methyltransferase, partial [Solirubrobacterales bacterium]|nr:protein-L-isoaspartate(D-aspartate) O-methyltransferase [Solirubrobacterales bacterium]